MILALLSITLIYLVVIGRFVFGFDKVEDFQVKELEPKTTFTIVIPFRNEAKHLPLLLESLSELQYPKELFEIMLVDDDSTDESNEVIMRFLTKAINNIKIIKNERTSESPKKDAISTAIKESKYDWILTTDADCIFHNQWLATLDAFIQQKRLKMVVGPVSYKTDNSFFQRFQSLDFMSLIGATIGGFGINKPFLCNGANLAYLKEVFIELEGFQGNDTIVSGDDIFLMEKVRNAYPNDIGYLKHENAIVKTSPQLSVSELISQRKRWAAKTSSYSNAFGKIIGSVVLLMNFSLLAAIFLALFGIFSFKMIGYVFLIKFSIDLWLIFKAAQFLNATDHLKSYVISSFLYPFFNVYVALTSWYSGYTWKGRKFQK